MRSKIANILVGLLFIIAGVGFCGNILDLWEFNLFFPGWWTMFIIIPCIYSMIRHGVNTGSIIGLGIGVLLLLHQLDFFPGKDLWKLIFPFVIIAIGISLIFGVFKKKNTPSVVISHPAGDGSCPDYSAVFGECTPNFTDVHFTGCTASAVFGGITLDLREAIIESDCAIEISTVFGGTEIFLPKNVKSNVTSTPIFGGVDDKSRSCNDPDAPTVFINATCVFGGTDIKQSK